MNKKVVVAGHICLDITPVFPQNCKGSIEEVLLPGKIVQTDGASVSTGGAVANTGLAMKKLGADVSLMGKVGSDAFGDMICSILKKYDADSGMIKVDGEESSYSVVVAIPGIDRTFLHCPGANNTYGADDVDEKALSDVSLFHFGYPPIMKKMYEEGGKELALLMSKVQKMGVATSLDMAAVDPNSEAGRADWLSIIKNVVPYLDFFVPSIEELCFMIDRPRFDSWNKRAQGGDIAKVLDFETDIKPLADMCMDMGCKVLMLKCGVQGLYLRTAKKSVLDNISKRLELNTDLWANKEIFEKPYMPEKILSATGAGDTSIAAFLTAILNGEDPATSMHLASAAGASCLTSYDALSGLKSFEELKEKINLGWSKLGDI